MNVELPWSDVVIGHYVWNAELGWMRVADRHPQDPLRFRLLDAVGNVHDVTLAAHQIVTVSAPHPDQSLEILRRYFQFKIKEEGRVVDPSQRGRGMPPPRTYA